MRLGFRRAPRHDVEQRERAVHRGIAAVDGQRRLQRALGAGFVAARPLVVGEREMRVGRLRRQRHRLAERFTGSRPVAADEPRGSERRPGRCVLRIERDRLLHLLDRPMALVQTGERVAEQDVRRRIIGIRLHRELRTPPRCIVLAGHQQQRPGLQLRVDVGRLQIGGARIGAVGIARIGR